MLLSPIMSGLARSRGGIGRRVRFRTVWGNPWRFESSREQGQGMESSFTQQEPTTIQHLFAQIADRYDLANTLLSLGLDSAWRAYVSARIARWAPRDVLDLATGSGVLAEAITRRIPAARVVGADFCAPMLAVARRRGIKELVVADGMALPFIMRGFAWVQMAFGFLHNGA